MKYESFTVTQMCLEANNVQYACNLIGVLNSFTDFLARAYELGLTNEDACIVAFANKIESLVDIDIDIEQTEENSERQPEKYLEQLRELVAALVKVRRDENLDSYKIGSHTLAREIVQLNRKYIPSDMRSIGDAFNALNTFDKLQ